MNLLLRPIQEAWQDGPIRGTPIVYSSRRPRPQRPRLKLPDEVLDEEEFMILFVTAATQRKGHR